MMTTEDSMNSGVDVPTASMMSLCHVTTLSNID